ncbi:MAG: biopolymer transporter ExbD [Planctomycetaceae bacterium]|nr:biopolymer transporter ExbD [Planctomycetales bacterium]MCB9923717.1 biopolymer transporter ExbD [Planctomycetaceae bacterium]
MPISFHCPSCDAKRSAHEILAGRKVRCPSCDALVEVPVDMTEEDGKATVALSPPEDDGTKTVMLEAVELEPVEVTEVIEDPPASSGRPPSTPPSDMPTVEEEEPSGIKRKGNVEDTEMDMTPMVDVTFLLLIFFMVTAAFTLQKSLQVPKPNPDEASETVQEQEEDDSDRVTVQVDEFNTYHVITVDWEEEAPSVQDLLRFLRQARDGDSTGKVPKTLLVEANGESLHEKVVAALDAGSDTGFEEVLLATVESE